MARIARVVIPNYPHHITQRGNRQQQTFFRPADYHLYMGLCRKYANKFGVKIWAYCLMPNHVHLVVIPENESSLAQCFSMTHQNYAYKVNKRNNWTGHLWQSRFFSCVMDENHLLASVRYIELNPVCAKLCDSPLDWPWSSARAHLTGQPDPLIMIEPMLERVDNWQEYLGNIGNDLKYESLRKHTSTGRPAGDKRFAEFISKLAGRKLTKQQPGRKTSDIK